MYDWLIRFTLHFLPQRTLGNNTPSNRAFHRSGYSLDAPVRPTDNRNRQFGLPRQEAQHLASQLDLCMSSLRQTCSRVEADFLNIGGRLQSIYTQAAQMCEKVRAAIEHVGLDGDNSTLSNIIQTAYRALSDLGLEQSKMAQRMKNLRCMREELNSLRSMAGGLRRIAKALRMVAININIESSRAAESHESFAVLSQEIRALSDTVASLDRTLLSEIQDITIKLESMQQVMDAKLKRFGQLSADARTVADRAEPECRALMDCSVKALQHVGADGEAISRNTSQIVVSLQIHDNVSQRVEHIAEALADSRQLVHQLMNEGLETCDFPDPVAAIDANLALQQVQLANIIADIDQVFQNSGRSFSVIGKTVQDMSSKILQIARGDTSCHSSNSGKTGSMGSLQAALEKIRILIGQGDEAVEELQTIGRDATAAVSRIGDLMEQVRNVNFDIHLKSLNAIFKSTHLGTRGRAIAVLVQEMKDLATQSKELVEQIESTNTTIMNRASRLQEQLPAVSAGGQDAAAVKSEILDASIRNFSDTSSAFTRHAEEMVRENETLSELIAAAGDQLVSLKPFAEQLRSQKQQLEACCSQLAPWVSAVSDGSAVLDKARLADRYTMQQERDIHTAVLDGESNRIDDRTVLAARSEVQDGQDGIAQQAGCNAEQESELGDNVELF
jgi:methyl-accepting chemotaxis protein